MSKPTTYDQIKWTALLIGLAAATPLVIMSIIWVLTWLIHWVTTSWSWP